MVRDRLSFAWEPAWLEALLTSVLDSAWLGFNLRLGVGSGLRLDSKLGPISWARLVSRLSSDDLGTRLVLVRFGTRGPARLSYGESARFGSVRGSRGKYVINTFNTALHQINAFGRTQYYQHLNVGSSYLHWSTKKHMNSALQTESTKLRNENCTIHVKRSRMNILIFNIFKIKWPKSEEKINFGGRWVWVPESSPTQNFVVTAWPWPHLCRPAPAASAAESMLNGSVTAVNH